MHLGNNSALSACDKKSTLNLNWTENKGSPGQIVQRLKLQRDPLCLDFYHIVEIQLQVSDQSPQKLVTLILSADRALVWGKKKTSEALTDILCLTVKQPNSRSSTFLFWFSPSREKKMSISLKNKPNILAFAHLSPRPYKEEC